MKSGIILEGNQVKIDNIYIDYIAKKYKTPVFIFSEKRLIENYLTFSKAFKTHYKNTSIYFSIKTNFELQILKTLKSLGSCGEAASALELQIAKKAGFLPSELIIDGPAWTDEDITYSIQNNIKTFNVDSIDELKRVNAIAKRLKKKVKISFRIFPEIKMSILKSFIEGYIAKFGVPLSKALDAYKFASTLSNVVPIAISSHIGSMITDPGYYERAIDRLVDLAKNIRQNLNITIEELNIGGGFGIQSLNYYSLQNVILEKAGISNYSKAASIKEFGARISKRFQQRIQESKIPSPKLALEPGRFIVSDSGILITRVVSVKDKWVFVDGGINLIPESIFFIRRGFIVANKVREKVAYKYNIAGPTLNTADVLAVDQKMPKMEVGDIVVVLDAGAYSLSRSNQFTILRPDALYLTKEGKIKYLRKEEKPEDIISKLL